MSAGAATTGCRSSCSRVLHRIDRFPHASKNSCSSFPHGWQGSQAAFEFQRRTIAQRRMQTLLVVDFFQKLLDQSPGFLEVAVFGAVDFLVFESLHETFRAGIVVGRCQSAHADTNAVLFELCGVVSRGILHPAVGMMD